MLEAILSYDKMTRKFSVARFAALRSPALQWEVDDTMLRNAKFYSDCLCTVGHARNPYSFSARA